MTRSPSATSFAGNVYGGGAVPYSVFPSWNHWPVAQIPSDGRYAIFPDRAAHCSLTHVYMPDYRADHGERPFQEKLLMEGMSRQGAKELVPLAKSWLQAPSFEAVSDCRGPGYDPSQRAFLLCATGPAPSFRIAASPEHPIVNPASWCGTGIPRKWGGWKSLPVHRQAAVGCARASCVMQTDGQRWSSGWNTARPRRSPSRCGARSRILPWSSSLWIRPAVNPAVPPASGPLNHHRRCNVTTTPPALKLKALGTVLPPHSTFTRLGAPSRPA